MREATKQQNQGQNQAESGMEKAKHSKDNQSKDLVKALVVESLADFSFEKRLSDGRRINLGVECYSSSDNC